MATTDERAGADPALSAAVPKSLSEVAPPQSAGASTFGAAVAASEGVVGRVGHYRWVICALLFFAATINYIDRQVIGILKPTLQTEIGWTEIQYSWIVFWFQAAYAVGLLVVGGLMDRFGTRKGFSVAIVFWSVAAMGHALARSVAGFSVARFALGSGRGGQLPGGDQDGGRVVPEEGARARHRHLQLGDERRRAGDAARRAVDHARLRLAVGVHHHGPRRLRLARLLARALPPTRKSTRDCRRRSWPTSRATRRTSP